MKHVNIPCSVTIEVEDEVSLDDEDALMNAVLDQHGKYIEVDARYLGYELAEEA